MSAGVAVQLKWWTCEAWTSLPFSVTSVMIVPSAPHADVTMGISVQTGRSVATNFEERMGYDYGKGL